jgi:4-amino-4-deoxychorismate lyase
MSRLIESIKLLDGEFCNLAYHERRMIHALRSLFGESSPVALEKFVKDSGFPQKGLFKCRIVYDASSMEKTFTPYVVKPVRRLRVVTDNFISYPFKFADRKALDRLSEYRGDCDDVLIVKNDKVTDCSYSNIVFRKGRDWFTSDSPLLEGTMRQNLIDKNKIRVVEILQKDIRSFDTFKIINAMLEFESPEIEVSEIVF